MQTETEKYCKNHANRTAKRQCYFCGDAICAECQQHAYHHIFCSSKCIRRFRLQQFFNTIKNFFRPVKSPLRGLTFRFLFDFLLLITLVIALLTIYRLWNYTKDLQRLLSSSDTQTSQQFGQLPKQDELIISQPAPGAMVLTNSIDIEGESENNHIISLSADGELIAVTMTENGKFRFENIKAKRGKNQLIIKSISESGAVSTLEKIEFTYGPRAPSYLARSFDRGDPAVKKIALTFDAGSTNNAAEEILDTLKEYKLRCTIFLTGQFILHYPETVKRMVADGHEIGNHTWSHPHLTTFAENNRHETLAGVTPEFLREELLSTEELFRSETKKSMVKLWRAPYGEHNLEIRQWAAELGYQQVGWTLGKDWEHSMDTLDWVADKNSSTYYSAEEILEKLVNFGNGDPRSANGAIILMHLGTQRKDDFPHKIIPELVSRMHEKGYTFVTISELM